MPLTDRRVPSVEQTDKIQKEHKHISHSLCMHQSLSFSLSLSLSLSLFKFAKTVWIYISPELYSGKNVITVT